MTTPYEIPLSPDAQTFNIQLAGKEYKLTFVWNANELAQCWMMDVTDVDGVRLLDGIPIITGLDIMRQFAYLVFGGSWIVQTDYAPDDVPTYENLGETGRLYFVTEP